MANTNSNSARAASLARRKAQSVSGKSAATASVAKSATASATSASADGNSARAASLARRKAQSVSGKGNNAPAARPTSQRRPAPAAAPKAPAPQAAAAPARSVRPRVAQAPASNPARSASLARRQAMSVHGKSAARGGDRTRTAADSVKPEAVKTEKDCGCGCGGKKDDAATQTTARTNTSTAKRKGSKVRPKNRLNPLTQNPSRAASKARRQAMSDRGKTAAGNGSTTPAQSARAANPNLSSRELAQTLRTQRSEKGRSTAQPSGSVGRRRPAKPEAAQDASWKVGASETTTGQTVTGTMVDRTDDVTGNEPSTCRDVTGTDYMGAEVFRDFCSSEPSAKPAKVAVTSTGSGNTVSGNKVGRSEKVTGDEPGSCKSVTGTEYLAAETMQSFCNSAPTPVAMSAARAETNKGKAVTGDNVGRSANVTGDEPGSGRQLTGSQYMATDTTGAAPSKVGTSQTLLGGSVSGTTVGRSEKVTGDEPGSQRNITGDDYVGAEQFGNEAPARTERKVGMSNTLKGKAVSGTMTGRAAAVTGDEPGTCQAVTGTPYAGAEQYRSYCEPKKSEEAFARDRVMRSTPAAPMTGIQPAVGGKMTGDDKGACKATTGTPYVGADQVAQACGTSAATPASSDFPQSIAMASGDFSVEAPSHASQATDTAGAVTGGQSESSRITGPFGMAANTVTGTEDFRFGKAAAAPVATVAAEETEAEMRAKSRVTGEGQSAGLKITGDDWDRGDRVTGTEGSSTLARNPTRQGGMSAMTNAPVKRNDEVPEPVSKVTGGGGVAIDKSLVTFSGGARG